MDRRRRSLTAQATPPRPRDMWRGWLATGNRQNRSVRSSRLGADAPVRSRLFPKTRSWLSLGAPLELMSPLSIIRVLYALAALLWSVEEVTLQWMKGSAWMLGVPPVTAAAVWIGLRFVKDLSARWCRLLAGLGAFLVLWQLAQGRAAASCLAAASFLAPLTIFVALYLGFRAVLLFESFVSVGAYLALMRALGAGDAAVTSVALVVGLLAVAFAVRVLVTSTWRSGSVDPDTGLENGVGLAQRIAAQRTSDGFLRPFTVAAVHLAGIDDARKALGYQVGTELLRRAVEDLGQVLPAGSAISRVEGDELVVTCNLPRDFRLATASGDQSESSDMWSGGEEPERFGDIPAAVTSAGRALSRSLAATINSGHYLVGRVEISLRAHIGLVFAPWNGTDVAELVRRASLAAGQAATSGQVEAIWDGSQAALGSYDLELLADLRLAAERGELRLVYQPQVEAETGETTAVEALLRWQSSAHGSVAPGRFIPLAERTGLIDRLTIWVVGEALDAQVRWRRAGLQLRVSVNVSAKTLAWPGLSDWILAELHSRHLPPSVLSIEVTETAAADLKQAVQLLRPLHTQGIRVSIDDFGTGFTSLAAIPFLPLDEIKVDMSFVQAAPTSAPDEAIVRSVRELVHRLGLVSVAEGIEDTATRDLMVDIGYDLLQGYYFAKPLAEAELMSYVRLPRGADR
jgi:EAL domain-containing protein (putative c-di-GMP-specific phosphodiesterase class I)/GGDEF domain-containing protein